MSHNTKSYRKKKIKSTSDGCKKIDTLFKALRQILAGNCYLVPNMARMKRIRSAIVISPSPSLLVTIKAQHVVMIIKMIVKMINLNFFLMQDNN